MKRNRMKSIAILSGVAVLSAIPAWSFFVGYSWNGGNGNWGDPLKWTPNNVPDGAGNSASISAAGTYTVTLDSNRSLDSVNIVGASSQLNLGTSTLTTTAGVTNGGTIISTSGTLAGPVTNQAGAAISVPAGNSMNLSSAALSNSGAINVNPSQAGANTTLNISGATTLSGAGTLSLYQAGTWAQLSSNVGVLLTNGPSHTINGRGQISALLANNGTVDASWGAATLLLNGQAKTNSGTMRSTAGWLTIEGAAVTQTGAGQILGANSQVFVRNGASITGGTLATSGAGAIVFDQGNASISNLTNTGAVNFTGGRNISVGSGLFANSGLYTINSNVAGVDTILNFTDNTTISGTGTIQMSQDGTWAQLTSDAGKTVTNASTHTIKGRGTLSAQLVNNGTVNADWGAQTLKLTGQPKTNTGILKASGGTPVLSIDGCAITQTGAGQVLADGANIGLRNGGSISGGALNTVGASNGFYCDTGDFTLQNLTTNGNLSVQGGRTLNIGAGLFANNGTLNVNYNQAGAITLLSFNENVSITGNGTIQMSQQGTWAEIATAAGKTLTNSATHTIKGRGQISAALVNNGNVIADWGGQTLALIGNTKTNNATIKSGFATSVLSVDGSTLNQSASGVLAAQDGNVGLRNGAVISGGTLSSSGSFGIYVDGGNATIQALTNASKLSVQGGNTLSVGSGAFTNNDLINLNYNQAGAPTVIEFMDNISIGGTGLIQMSQAGTWAEMKTAAGKTVTNGASHTIKGRGFISGSLVNNGTVIADWGSQELELNGSDKTNNGTMKSAGSASALVVKNCTVNQSPAGRIWAESSNVGIRGSAVINGGRLESQPTFAHYVDNGAPTLNGVTNLGAVNIAQGLDLNIGASGLTDNGTVNVNYGQGGANTRIVVPASATIGGSGLIQMSQAGSWAQIAVAAGQTLTHDTGHTIQGRGQINGAVVNKGNIYANWGSQSMEINPAAPGFTNQGTMGITFGTSGMTINSANLFTNAGTMNIIAGPTLTVNGGDYTQTAGVTSVEGVLDVTGAGKVNLTGGVLKGSGIVDAPVQNGGTGEVAPGNSAGKLRIQGAFTQQNPGTTTIELGGTTPVVEHDVLEVTGAATLNGTLRLKIINAFTPTPAMTFTVLTAGAVSGSYSNVVVEGGSVDLEPSVVYTSTQVQVTFLNKVTPTSFAITGGFYAGGSLSSLFNSDNDYIYDLCDEDNSTGRIEVTSASPIASPTKLRFAFEAGCVRNDMVEQVEMFNYTSNQWVLIPPTQVGSISDRRRVVIVTTNPQQYVKAGTLEIKARVTWIPSLDTSAFDGWTTRIDQCAWFIGP